MYVDNALIDGDGNLFWFDSTSDADYFKLHHDARELTNEEKTALTEQLNTGGPVSVLKPKVTVSDLKNRVELGAYPYDGL